MDRRRSSAFRAILTALNLVQSNRTRSTRIARYLGGGSVYVFFGSGLALPSRWDPAPWYSSDPSESGKTITRRAALLRDADLFDAAYFHITPAEARAMDPHQRLLLQVGSEALLQAGVVDAGPSPIPEGLDVGVFVAFSNHEFALLTTADPHTTGPFSLTGMAPCLAANRLVRPQVGGCAVF